MDQSCRGDGLDGALINEQRIADLLEVVRRELADLADRVGDAARHSDVQRAEARRAVREATWDPRSQPEA